MPSGKSRRRSERQQLNLLAGFVRKAIEHYKQAARCKAGSKAERNALAHAENFWGNAGSIISTICICNMENPARVLHRVALALENKLPTNTGWRDAQILAAYSAAHSSAVFVPFREIKAKFVEKFGKETLPNDYSFRRSLKRLGCLNVAGASGRPRKKPAPKL